MEISTEYATTLEVHTFSIEYKDKCFNDMEVVSTNSDLYVSYDNVDVNKLQINHKTAYYSLPYCGDFSL